MKITRQVFFLTLCGEILKVDIRLSEIHIQKATNLSLAIKKAEFASLLLFLIHVEGSTCIRLVHMTSSTSTWVLILEKDRGLRTKD